MSESRPRNHRDDVNVSGRTGWCPHELVGTDDNRAAQAPTLFRSESERQPQTRIEHTTDTTKVFVRVDGEMFELSVSIDAFPSEADGLEEHRRRPTRPLTLRAVRSRPLMRLPSNRPIVAAIVTALSVCLPAVVWLFTDTGKPRRQPDVSVAVPRELAATPVTAIAAYVATIESHQPDVNAAADVAPREATPPPAAITAARPATADSLSSAASSDATRVTAGPGAAVRNAPGLAEPLVPLPAQPDQVAAAPALARPLTETSGSPARPPERPVSVGETDLIGGVLTRYRGAFNALDSAAAKSVWPTVDERALARAFAGLRQQEVAFENCHIDVAGASAAARCSGVARYVPKVGSPNARTTAREWRFDLQKVDDRWVIEAVDVR